MKRIVHRSLALLLVLALLATAAGAASLGSMLRQDTLELSDTAALTHGVLYQSSISARQTENVVTYQPGSAAHPVVAFGSTLFGRSTLSHVASYLAAQGKNTLFGMNASFFDLETGIPYGCEITDGILRTSGNVQSVGFRADGTAVIGQPGLSLSISYPGGGTSLTHYNKALTTTNGIVLYSRDYDTKTKNTVSAYNIVLKPSADTLKPDGSITAMVVSVAADTASCDIPEGEMVLSMATDSIYSSTLANRLKPLAAGDVLTISSTISDEWKDVVYACGGDDLLVRGGTAQSDFTLDSADNRTSRTAVGLKSDGTVVFYTVDGLQDGYSVGLRLPELAERMTELGCVTALNLDGGGSTTLAARYPGYSTFATVNQPSDGAPRKCANFIFLVTDSTAAGEAASLHLYPYDAAVLCGSSQQLTVRAADANGNAAAVPTDLTYSASGGTVSPSGIFTAGADSVTAAVTVASSSGLTGTRSIHVVKTPSSITVKNESTGKAVSSLSVASGRSVALTGSAVYLGYELASQDTAYAWAVTPALGKIDATGKFTAAETYSTLTGTITCSAGGRTVSVPVTVGAAAPTGGAILGFEAGETAVSSGTGAAASVNTAHAYVRYGARSLRIGYDLSKAAVSGSSKRQAAVTLSQALPDGCDTVGLWVFGDGSGNHLSVRFSDGTTETSKWIAQLNFSGWKYVLADIPTGATGVTGFTVTENDNSPSAGTIYLDQLVAASGKLSDTTPPSVAASLSGTTVSVTVTDGGSGVGSVAATVDGATQTAAFVGGKGSLTAPADGAAHRVQITASDACGNLTSRSVAVSGVLSNPFFDLNDHWSRVYVDYCSREGLLSGSKDASGNLLYRPDDPMTRQEFAAAVVRFLGIDADAYASTALPFADSAKIASWAVGPMKAAYALGLVTGSRDGGKLWANPASTVTRQEAMAILGRTQARGYQEDSLAAFSDAASVASWARSDIAAMVTRGVIAGTGGNLNPNGSVTRAQVAKMLYSLY